MKKLKIYEKNTFSINVMYPFMFANHVTNAQLRICNTYNACKCSIQRIYTFSQVKK